MMKTLKNILPLIICCAGMTLAAQTAQPAAASETTVAKTPLYDRVVKEFSAFPHRVPGSPEYYKAVGTVRKTAYAVMNAPDITKLVIRFGRYHHKVDWKAVAVKILDTKYRKYSK